MATAIPNNRCAFTLGEARAAAGGTLVGGDSAARATSVSIDTRTLERGAIFVALRGESADGHGYLDRAADRGAAAAVVERGRAFARLPCIEVADTLVALGALAAHHLERTRRTRELPVITIGGAAGKTTTKELTAAAARTLFGAVLATPGNLNNRIGVPMTLFTLAAEHRAAVLECGTNLRGEIPRLAAIVKPDVAMILNIDLEHSAGLGTLDEIADEEAAIFAAARKYAVVPADEPLLAARMPAHLPRITFGAAPHADVRVEGRTAVPGGRSRISLRLGSALVSAGESPLLVSEISLLGAAAALNCAAALAGALAMSPNRITGDQLRAIAGAFAAARPIARRLEPVTIGGALVIDDSYNAQPPSVRVAIATAREVAEATGARLVIVLGDMLELGSLSRAAHVEAVRAVFAARPAEFVATGPEMTAALDAVRGDADASAVNSTPVADSAQAGAIARAIVQRGDVVLVKGSLGMAMDRVIDALKAGAVTVS
jgi:UDP-N-acetylmuramoyl-tripeptide--D-alanyl-D-alanine ligase